MSKKGKFFRVKGSLLVAVIGDEPTVSGFLLTGIGERNRKGEANFLIVNKDTTLSQIETTFKKFTDREDIGIILISQHVAEQIRNLIAEHDAVLPTILEIPSKDYAYDPEKDTILTRAARILWGNEAGMEKIKEP
jgi:V-type H+-transporting ATPase subunit F